MPACSCVLALLLVSCAKAPEQRPATGDYSRSEFRPVSGRRTLCVFMDGTANDYDSHTNVRRLYEMISAPRDPEVLCYYDHGVGSNELPLTGMIGGAGFSKNLSQAYDFLRNNYDHSRRDRIFLFGYSRGARQAQVLCDLLDECGLARPGDRGGHLGGTDDELKQARNLIRAYKRRVPKRNKGDTSLPKLQEETGFPVPTIQLVGIFECVESMANNILRGAMNRSLRKGSYKDHRYYQYHLPGNVKEAYHAMALDEMRGMYEVIEWTVPAEKGPNQVLEQVWFAGSHGDVGGGYENSQSLAGIPLNWMLGKLEPHDLVPGDIRVHTDIYTPVTHSLDFFIPGRVLSLFRQPMPRTHQFWFDREDNPKHPSSHAHAFDIDIKPLVHESVIARMRLALPKNDRDKLEQFGVYRPRQFYVVERITQLHRKPGRYESWPPEGELITYYRGKDDGNPALSAVIVDRNRLLPALTIVNTAGGR